MTNQLIAAIGLAAIILSACSAQTSETSGEVSSIKPDMNDCLRTVLTLDEGTWDYMGVIARLDGTYRTFETTSTHAAAGDDIWSSSSSGGDISEDYSGETEYHKLVGTWLRPYEDGEAKDEGGVEFTSCTGPDEEGRYAFTLKYNMPLQDGSPIYVTNKTWRSEHGSHFHEEHVDETGRLRARRSGVYTPAKD